MLGLWFIFVFVVAIWYACFRYSRRRMYELAAVVPGLPEKPIIGHALDFIGDNTDIMENLKNIIRHAYQNNGVTKIWLGPRLYFGIINPEDAENVLNFALDKDSVYSFLSVWMGRGLVTGEVPIWKVHRKMITPTFHQKILNSFMEVFATQSRILVEKLNREVGKDPFDPFLYFSPCTLDIICETAMGIQVNAQKDTNIPFIQAGYTILQIVGKRMFQIWLQPDVLFRLSKYYKIQKDCVDIVSVFGLNVVKKKKENYYKNKTNECVENADPDDMKRYAFLDLMIRQSENGNKLTDQELREEVDTMIIAGNDTTARAMSFVLMMLGLFPEIQDKVYSELEEIFGDTGRSIEVEDLPKLIYLERVIKETLRIFPVAPVVVRKIKQEIQLKSNVTLPKGSGCVVAIYGIHRDPRWWGENPDDFDPDNFLPERCAKRPSHAFMPFSAGPRNCIGQRYAMMSLKSVLSTVLRSYKVYSDVDYKTLKLQTEILLKPLENTANIRIERRHPNWKQSQKPSL